MTLFLATLAVGCSEPSAEPDPKAEAWNTRCEVDSECIGKSICACGICSKLCVQTEECAFREEAACVDVNDSSVALLCGDERPATSGGLCLRECESEADCLDGKTCVAMSCVIFDPPSSDTCRPTTGWAPSVVDLERVMLARVNGARKQGQVDCGAIGTIGSVPTLRLNAELECAARLHAKQMDEENYLDLVSPDGTTSGDRVRSVGYEPTVVGGNVITGEDPGATLAKLLGTPVDCEVVMSRDFMDIGIGRSGNVWSIIYAQPQELP